MHENRETSLTTGSGKSSPAGKDQGRKASTKVKEESDCAVLPMKLANQATEQEPEAAEPVEGRARTRENTVQCNTPPAQDGKGVSQGLSGVCKVAR